MKKYLSFLVALSFFGCSNLSKNIVEKGDYFLSNGTYAEKTWKEDLKFERYSWFHELTMQFDLMIATIPPQSGFNFWFSKDELTSLNNCKDARVVFAYSLDTKIIPYSTLYAHLENSGFTRIELPDFKRQLLQHPDSNMNSLRLYHVLGICRTKLNSKPLVINFPGYTEKLIN